MDYLAFVAIWAFNGKEIIIGAPTLKDLAQQWTRITGSRLDKKSAQEVVIYQSSKITVNSPDKTTKSAQ